MGKQTYFLILGIGLNSGFSNVAEVLSSPKAQRLPDESYLSLEWTKCYYPSRARGSSRSARSEVRGDWRSVLFGETTRAPFDRASRVPTLCVWRPGSYDGSRDSKVHESLLLIPMPVVPLFFCSCVKSF